MGRLADAFGCDCAGFLQAPARLLARDLVLVDRKACPGRAAAGRRSVRVRTEIRCSQGGGEDGEQDRKDDANEEGGGFRRSRTGQRLPRVARVQKGCYPPPKDNLLTRVLQQLDDDQRLFVTTLYITLVISAMLSISASTVRLFAVLGLPPFALAH